MLTAPAQHRSGALLKFGKQYKMESAAVISGWTTWLTHGEWVMASLTLIYVVFTGCYVWISRSTLSALKAQAKSNADQFNEQLEVLKTSGQKTDELIKQAAAQAGALIKVAQATEQNAVAAQASADALRASVEAASNRDRARIKVVLGNVVPQSQSVDPGGRNGVTCSLTNYGGTVAFITDSRAKYCLSPSLETVAQFDQCKQLMYDEALQPNTSTPQFLLLLEPDSALTDEQVMSIRNGTSSLHVYAFVRHQDVFRRNWKTTVHMRWKMRWGGVIEGITTAYWEPAGPPEDNREVEDSLI
jgi:hypothetical protein